MVPWVGLACVVVVFSIHTHLRFDSVGGSSLCDCVIPRSITFSIIVNPYSFPITLTACMYGDRQGLQPKSLTFSLAIMHI